MSHTQNSNQLHHNIPVYTTYTTPPLDLSTSYVDPVLINLEYDPQFPAPVPAAEWTTVTDVSPLPLQLPQEDLYKKFQEIERQNKALIQVKFN